MASSGSTAPSDTYHERPAYLAMLGNEFQTHGAQATVEAVVEAPSHPAVAPPRHALPGVRRDLPLHPQQPRRGHAAADAGPPSRRRPGSRRRARRPAAGLDAGARPGTACSTPPWAIATSSGSTPPSSATSSAVCAGRRSRRLRRPIAPWAPVSPAARPRWWRCRSSSSASSPRRHAWPHRHQPRARR